MPAIDLNNMTVHFIDVGQGDSILIQVNGKNMLIDAGEQKAGDRVVSYLKDNDVEELDVIVATHAHADHIGGMVNVLNNFKVKRFIDSGNPHTSKTF
ncbi:MAG: MBL fold metallo-hydrolase [Methanolobus sp.]